MTSYAGAILQEDAQRIIAALPAETIPAMQAIALAVGILAAKLECQCEGSGEVCLDSLAASFKDLPNTPEWRMILLLAGRPPA